MKRTYQRALRDAQAAQTAQRILDAAAALVARGDRELAYTQLAQVAGVSVPTVYRHFPTREDLFRAFAAAHASAHPTPAVADPASAARLFYARFDDPEDPLYRGREGRLGTLWEFSRVGTVPGRRAWFDAHLRKVAPHVPEPERTWLVDLGVVLVSSALGEAFHGYLDRTGAETADRVAFALDALLDRARALSAQAEPRETAPGDLEEP